MHGYSILLYVIRDEDTVKGDIKEEQKGEAKAKRM